MIKLKSKKFILSIFLCICLAVCIVFSFNKTTSVQAYNTNDLAVTTTCIDNIYDETQGKFLENNLSKIAKKAGLGNLTNMIKYINDGGQPKTAADFQHCTVKFGKSYGGDGTGATELVWIPVYLSNSAQGPILTLWLASTDETAVFNTQYNSSSSTKPSSNNYSTSYIRTATLNNTGVYYNGYGNTTTNKTSALIAVNYTATNANTHRFQMYTTGVLKDYIVIPSRVSWQSTANRMKNDPNWKGNSTGNYFMDKSGATQTWINDRLWLPSMYEVRDGSLTANSTEVGMASKSTAGVFNENAAGLWGTNANERNSSTFAWTRSSHPTTFEESGVIVPSGYSYSNVNNAMAVRPALHLNLGSALKDSVSDHVHEWENNSNDGWVVTKQATCSIPGLKERVCTVADCTLMDNKETEELPINPTVHMSGTAATCTSAQTCTGCGTEITAAKGHTEVTDKAVDPTCTETGKTAGSHCSVCNEIIVAQTTIPANGHTEVEDKAVAPDCTTTGLTAGSHCSVCGETLTAQQIVPANGHASSDWITDDDPTCTEEGSKHKECTVCHTTLETGTIPETGHDYSDEWETDGSNHWHICANECGIKGSNAAHIFEWKIDKAASFTETGLRHEECTVCHLKRNENTVIPLVTCLHSNTTHYDKVPATCVKKGTVEYKYCSDCQKNLDMSDVELSDLEIPIDPNNHAWGEWEVTAQATCAEKGTEKRTCADCNHEETRDIAIDPNAHDLEHHDAQDPTCTEIGWNAYDECSRCDYSTYSEIPAKGHDFSITVDGTPPTCQEGGTATMKCSRCEETKVQDSAEPVDHVYTNYVSDNNATCTQNGTKTAECDFGCGATDTIEDEGSATGHTPGEEATCTAAQTCEVCGTELAPALGHDWSTEWSKDETNHWHICSRCDELNENTTHTYEWIITKEATIEESGLMENLCTVCGNKDGEEEIAKLIDPNGEIDLPVDINVEFKVTQSSTGNNYSEIDKSLKLGYWAQLWYRNDDGTLGNEFTDTINCFLTLKIPTDIIEAIRGGEEINRDKIAAGLKVYYIDGEGTPVEVENFTIAMRDDDSWQIKFNYNEKFRAEVVFAADLAEPVPEEPASGIPWWVWLLVILGSATLLAIIIVIIVVAKKKDNSDGGTPSDNGEVLQRLDDQGQILNELLNRGDDGGFNTPVELDENGNVIFK